MVKTNPLLTVENLAYSIGEKKILEDINFQIKDIHREGVLQGQVCSIVGRSGIGKSTLLGLLAGFLTPTNGSIKIGENQKPNMIGDMGVVFQNSYVYEWKKVSKIFKSALKKNVNINPLSYDIEIENITSAFEIEHCLNKYSNELSGGERQRVAIAEQILNGSDFIIFDEPFSGLDPLMLDKVIKIIQKVSLMSETKTLLIISHDLRNSVAISDTVYILNKNSNEEGATIVDTVDLISRDLAWHDNIKNTQEFIKTVEEIKEKMKKKY